VHVIATAALAAGATAATSSKSSGGIGNWLLPAVILLALVYFFTSQRRRTRQAQQEQAKLGPGTLIVTRGGLYGTIVEVDGQDILLEIAPDTVVRFSRQAIGRVVSTPPDADATVHDEPVGDDQAAVSLDKKDTADD
jgi:preprotein translocase subunit YajC